MDALLFISLSFFINILVTYSILKNRTNKKFKNVVGKIKMNYLYLMYGKKAKYDKILLPILIGIFMILYFLLDIFIYNLNIDIYKLITAITSEILIILPLVIFWKSINRDEDVYICKDGIRYGNLFIKWEDFDGYIKKDGYLILKRKINSKFIQILSTPMKLYLKDDIEDIVKIYLKEIGR